MSEEEIKKLRSIRGAYKGHCTQDFKRAEKLITSETPDQAELEALVDRLTRRAEEIARMEKNRDVLGDRRGHTTRHRNGVVVPRRRIILAIQNRTTP